MLTHPADSNPQIVFPMDEDALPPNPVCSSPPHSEPPSPHLPLSSVTPSCLNDGISGNRSSDRIQRIKSPENQSNEQSRAAERPPPPNRQRESRNMVEGSQPQHPAVESTHETQNKDEFDFCPEEAESQNKEKSPIKNQTMFISDNQTEEFDTTHIPANTESELGACKAVENMSASKGWVIGPLFQSLKSKMASFTEIVMTPVKLFKPDSPLSMDSAHILNVCELQEDPAPEAAASAQSANGASQQSPRCQTEGKSRTGHSRRLAFDVALKTSSGQPPARTLTPSQPASAVLLQPFVTLCASLKTSKDVVELTGQGKPRPRKRTANRRDSKKVPSKTRTREVEHKESDPELTHTTSTPSDSSDVTNTLSLISSVCYIQPGADWPPLDGKDAADCPVGQSLRTSIDAGANDGTRRLPLDPGGPDCKRNPELIVGRSKRGLKSESHSKGSGKRKKLTADSCTQDSRKESVDSESSPPPGPRPLPKPLTSTDPVLDGEVTPKPASKRPSVSTRADRKKGRGGTGLPPALDEAGKQPESVSDAASGKSTKLEKRPKSSGRKTQPRGPSKKLKTTAEVVEPDSDTGERMDVETHVGGASPKQTQVLVPRSGGKQPHDAHARKKPQKRKSPNRVLSSSDGVPAPSECELVSFEPTPADVCHSQQVQEEGRLKKTLRQWSKRPKRDCKGSSSVSGGSREAKQQKKDVHVPTKDSRRKSGSVKMSADPVYFEMTPSGDRCPPVSTQPPPQCSCTVNGEEKSSSCTSNAEAIDPNSTGRSVGSGRTRPSARRAKVKRRAGQSGKCSTVRSRTCAEEEGADSVTMEEADLGPGSPESSRCSGRLLRSYSCPDIPSFRDPTGAGLPTPQHRTQPSHQHRPALGPAATLSLKALHRARRHTVSSMEVEREIAPLCLRKEVYPSRRSVPYDSFTQHLPPALSPSTALSVFASCFLSSPLAFLSRRVESGGHQSPSTSAHTSSSALTSPSSSSTWQLPGLLQKTDSSGTSLDSGTSGSLLESETERQSEEEEEEETSSSSQELDAALREEKALSDSEIKAVQRHEERGKVSSIRIRKTLPKPQNNLTPMGLPKPIRLKKKEFSLEEIYTNQNFSKPPERRLETIFEVPLSRRNGSECWFGHRRVKRFLEFLEVGEVRKPKKLLAGVGKAGNSTSRTRRGGFTKDEPSLVQNVDSLLCAKLEELRLWLMHDQTDS